MHEVSSGQGLFNGPTAQTRNAPVLESIHIHASCAKRAGYHAFADARPFYDFLIPEHFARA